MSHIIIYTYKKNILLTNILYFKKCKSMNINKYDLQNIFSQFDNFVAL